MGEQYRLLLDDLKSAAAERFTLAGQARNSTRKERTDTEFADRCHTLAEAHHAAGLAYEKILAEVSANLAKRKKERSDGR